MERPMRLLTAGMAASLALLAQLAAAEELPSAQPGEVGLAADRLDRIGQVLRDDIGNGAIPGAVLLIVRHGKAAYFEAFGALDPDGKAPMTKDAIFRIYSMSKPITTVAAMMLVEEGKLTLEEPISKYLPEFKTVKVGVERSEADHAPSLDLVEAKRQITVQDLMRHTLRVSPMGSSATSW